MSNGGSTPDQYALPKGADELQDLIEYRGMDFALGNIFKACYRLGKKGNALYDINKIIWFAKRIKSSLTLTVSDMSINRLIENGAAMALKVVSTGDKNALLEAIEVLQEAHHKMRMADIEKT